MSKPVVVLAFGELLWDLLPTGRVPGGAPANFAFHCQQLGHAAAVVSRVGNDELGRDLVAWLRGTGVNADYVQTDPVRPTGTVRVTLEAGQPTYTIAEEVAWDYIGWNDDLERLVTSPTPRVVYYGSLAQRSAVSRATLGRCRARSPRKLCVFDMNLRQHYFDHPTLKSEVGNTDWVKLNSDEMVTLAGFEGFSAADPASHIDDVFFLNDPARDLVCLTRGADGCLVRTPAETIDQCGTRVVDLVDAVGAGDSFTAALVCLHHLESKSLAESVRFAARYAAEVCRHAGATPKIDRAALESAT